MKDGWNQHKCREAQTIPSKRNVLCLSSQRKHMRWGTSCVMTLVFNIRRSRCQPRTRTVPKLGEQAHLTKVWRICLRDPKTIWKGYGIFRILLFTLFSDIPLHREQIRLLLGGLRSVSSLKILHLCIQLNASPNLCVKLKLQVDEPCLS